MLQLFVVSLQGSAMASINKRKGVITGTDAVEDYATVYCDVSRTSCFRVLSRLLYA